MSQEERNIQSSSSNNFKLKDLKDIRDMNNQRNSGYIFNNTENNSNYNILNKSNQNEMKYSSNNSYIKNGGPSSLNKTPNFYRLQ